MPMDYRGIDRKQALIRRLTRNWVDRLGLAWFKVSNIYTLNSGDFPSPETVAETKVEWKYLEAEVRWNMPHIVNLDLSASRLEEIVIHELCHILLEETKEEGQHHQERVATLIQKAIWWTWEAGLAKGRREKAKPKKRTTRKRSKR